MLVSTFTFLWAVLNSALLIAIPVLIIRFLRKR